MSAFWFWFGVAGTAFGLITSLIFLTDWGRSRWRAVRDFVKFWFSLKKRIETLENPKPRTWELQHCPICGKRGELDEKSLMYKGKWTAWFACHECKKVWPVPLE